MKGISLSLLVDKSLGSAFGCSFYLDGQMVRGIGLIVWQETGRNLVTRRSGKEVCT